MRRLTDLARGTLSLSIYTANTLFWCGLLFILAGVKALVPLSAWRTWFTRRLHWVAENWIWVNNLNQTLLGRTDWNVANLEPLRRRGWYLVLANHQSWVDILVLQRIFNRKIPLLMFFIKKKLFWFPVLGQAWWALDFPFVKRYTKSQLEKNPRLIGKDLEATRKAGKRFKKTPTSMMNFPEGTRFSQGKHDRQASPYAHLLKPKAGGIASVIQMMGDCLDGVLDVTIVYPDRVPTFWTFISGKTREIRVSLRYLTVTPELVGDYAADATFRDIFQAWLNANWTEKDALFGRLALEEPPLSG